MAQALRQFDRSDDPARIMAAIEQHGGVIVRDFLDPDLHQRLVEQLDPGVQSTAAGLSDGSTKQGFWGEQTKRFTGLARRSPAFAEVIDDDLLHAWAEEGFRNDYWLNTGQAMIVGPGSQPQVLHRDAGNWPIALMSADGPEVTLSAMLALSDFTAENGATRVVPGSHGWADFRREPTADEFVQAVMPARSALLYTGKTLHGAGPNTSADTWRFGVHISFTLAQLTPEEAHTVTVPWDVARHFPTRVQHMLGYCSHRTFLPDWPALWTYDYHDVRDALQPPPADEYVSAGARWLRKPSSADSK